MQYIYAVTAVIQSKSIDDNEPVTVQWYTGPSLAKAITALAQSVADHDDLDPGVPEAARYRTLSAGIQITADATESTIERLVALSADITAGMPAGTD